MVGKEQIPTMSTITIAVIALLISSSLVVYNLSSTQPMQLYSFIVYIDPISGNYTAKAANGTMFWSSTDAKNVVQSAITATTDDTVAFKTGIFQISAKLTGKSGVNLKGTERNTVLNFTFETDYGFYCSNAANVEVSGFTFINKRNPQGNYTLFFDDGCTDIVVRDNNFTGGRICVNFGLSNRITVQGNTFYDFNNAIAGRGVTYADISLNIIYNGIDNAIDLQPYGQVNVHDNDIFDTRASPLINNGIYITDPFWSNSIYNNKLRNLMLAGICVVNSVATSPTQQINVYENTVDRCGIEGNSAGILLYGVAIGDEILNSVIQNNRVNMSGQDGIRLSTANNSFITGNVCTNNGQNNTVYNAGITLESCQNVTLLTNRAYDSQTVKTQSYGIKDRGANTEIHIRYNDVRNNNYTAGITGFANQDVRDNIGYNPLGLSITTPSFPASDVDVTNTFSFPVKIYMLTIGTTTAYQITDSLGNAQSVTTVLSAGMEITLDPNAKIQFTYTVAPTWKWYGT